MDAVVVHTTSKKNLSPLGPIRIILFAWGAYLAWLLALQVSGTGIGFKVWPIGEDRNWLYLLRSGNPIQIFQEFWALDSRNPLAAFWWILISPIIKVSDWGLHVVSLIVSPLIAIVTFLTLDRLDRGRSRLFALLVALLVLLWNFPARHDHVDRVMVIALAFSLLTIFLYARFIDEDRRRKGLLLSALFCYLIALATYTIQSGAIIAVPFLVLFRLQRPLKSRLLWAGCDSIFFFTTFMAYTLTWMHFAGPSSGSTFHIAYSDLLANVSVSLKAFIFPSSNQQFIDVAKAEFLESQRIFWYFFSAVSGFFLVLSIVLGSRLTATFPPLGWIGLLLVSIGLPTVFVEAGNPMWGPGSRSIMLLQVWEPVLIVSLIFVAASLIRNEAARRWACAIAVSLVCAVMLFVTIGFNHLQTEVSFYQRNLALALREIDSGQEVPMNYLVKIHNPVSPKVGSEPTLASYAPTILGRNDTSLRLFVSYPSPAPAYDEVWKVTFKDEGVINAKASFDRSFVKYDNLKIVYFDGVSLTVPGLVTQEDFQGLQVKWDRTLPIVQ
ncbi:hypothetical protein HX866_04445 [Pseudomonas gingeri]|uniref:hypothetical protein n=1 Tax=Pseudomonas gingeri TaxID=117681 RepID=UPI0015A19705|nr:hypothetical protein [Pseudomonas gingeri]NWA24133.1 hypothetical protein [Pseudomonas gingeri]